MINQKYLFELLNKKGIYTLTELADLLNLNYHTLRYQLKTGNISLASALSISEFLSVSPFFFASSKTFFIHFISLGEEDIVYELRELGNVSYLMFHLLSMDQIP